MQTRDVIATPLPPHTASAQSSAKSESGAGPLDNRGSVDDATLLRHLAPLRLSGTEHSGYGGMRLSRVQGGKQAYFGDVYETDDGDGPVQVYTTAPVAPPANGIPAAVKSARIMSAAF